MHFGVADSEPVQLKSIHKGWTVRNPTAVYLASFIIRTLACPPNLLVPGLLCTHANYA